MADVKFTFVVFHNIFHSFVGPGNFRWNSFFALHPNNTGVYVLGRIYVRTIDGIGIYIGSLSGNLFHTVITNNLVYKQYYIYDHFIETFDTDNTQWQWVPARIPYKPKYTYISGHDVNGASLYTSRTVINQTTVYGYTTENSSCALFGFNNSVHCASTFDVLHHKGKLNGTVL